ncbi:MAG: biopolymer transporter ExbD [Calditrichaeota bacterium]|nr:biopolymer transporter ExbD [Calditrichota bacterium]RQV92720.1 MAG: biopolymer transporter ExbD [bacterium]RQW00392.1 MAG: biopolymer transporter ExbD [Calditrichota bacterium]
MRLLTGKKNSRSLLNITPLIDVLFILIIFFAVSSTFLEQPGIKLALPEAEETEVQKIEKAVLFISADEQLLFRDKEINLDNLGPMLKDAMDQSQDKSLIINADKGVAHGVVVTVMDIARQSGVQKLVIATEQK